MRRYAYDDPLCGIDTSSRYPTQCRLQTQEVEVSYTLQLYEMIMRRLPPESHTRRLPPESHTSSPQGVATA